jgi:beta-galactosidase/beta-glucuronidase
MVRDDVRWSAHIAVPYALETSASGVGDRSFYKACWYRRSSTLPPIEPFHRRLLHFGAVDYRATVWVNGLLCGEHEGGYTPFTVDITSLATDRHCEIVLLAEDDPHDLAKPRGKQDWQREPHAIWYPRTTGIWQTVWMEDAPDPGFTISPLPPILRDGKLGLEAWFGGEM